ncbi:hypothetical protein EDD85DRAFT_792796 [Armillaria nabsnona]|nr:hypothetical protein EDD85DRAFT_792796 [Armillaria nabsnona]
MRQACRREDRRLSSDAESSVFKLLVQEDKVHINPMDPEAQLIAGAIAAFQDNNKRRTCRGITVTTFLTFPTDRSDWVIVSDIANIQLRRPLSIATRLVYQGTGRDEGMRPLPNHEVNECLKGAWS